MSVCKCSSLPSTCYRNVSRQAKPLPKDEDLQLLSIDLGKVIQAARCLIGTIPNKSVRSSEDGDATLTFLQELHDGLVKDCRLSSNTYSGMILSGTKLKTLNSVIEEELSGCLASDGQGLSIFKSSLRDLLDDDIPSGQIVAKAVLCLYAYIKWRLSIVLLVDIKPYQGVKVLLLEIGRTLAQMQLLKQ